MMKPKYNNILIDAVMHLAHDLDEHADGRIGRPLLDGRKHALAHARLLRHRIEAHTLGLADVIEVDGDIVYEIIHILTLSRDCPLNIPQNGPEVKVSSPPAVPINLYRSASVAIMTARFYSPVFTMPRPTRRIPLFFKKLHQKIEEDTVTSML